MGTMDHERFEPLAWGPRASWAERPWAMGEESSARLSNLGRRGGLFANISSTKSMGQPREIPPVAYRNISTPGGAFYQRRNYMVYSWARSSEKRRVLISRHPPGAPRSITGFQRPSGAVKSDFVLFLGGIPRLVSGLLGASCGLGLDQTIRWVSFVIFNDFRMTSRIR